MGSSSEPGAKPPRIRLGMVGGGEGAFIGAVHRMAARLDDHYTLVAGALSATPEKALRSGLALGLAPDRLYSDFRAMAQAEAARPDGIEAVAIVTPNHLHAPAAQAFLEAGIHVICDKPVTTTSAEALALQATVERSGLLFAVTHNYSANAMVRQARELVRSGALGEIRVVQVEYPQDWLAEPLEATAQKQADWRTDPARSGAGGCVGDIGTHAFQLAEFVTGLQVHSLLAEVSTFVPGRRLDDDVQVLLRFAGGARGTLWASQVAPGHRNGLALRVYGSRGGLAWRQEQPEDLLYTPLGEPTRVIGRGAAGAGAAAQQVTRTPGGHPEGYLEAFATVYSEVAQALYARREGRRLDEAALNFPTLADGLRGVRFIETVVASGRAGGQWVALPR
ncbi:Gfo/Idh/MocA family protein [Ideonella livida]|uniref:Gfo/Idh/MocA family oxidoreductase n=1 Tax=Ideonella livida TaxID=2707176 RepID=A0A7C9TKI6_9BURK|nr:Gfo/Idh/MocA family oxidoreductase [Ideonella livida]NDY91882.1 Gfo/Idh/MocA family oxidoreductase [Ideonella livida]